MVQVFVDMDGVLADFDLYYENMFGVRPDKAIDNVDWKKVKEQKDFYLGIPPMPDAFELWEFVSRLTPKPIILTGIPSSVKEAGGNKRAWVDKNLGKHVEVRGCPSKDKCIHARPGDILIDDWPKYRSFWLAKGGRWITHTSAESSINQLLELGIGL